MRPSLCFLALAALAGCALFSSATSGSEGVAVYGADAEANLEKGNEALEAKNFPEAQQYFEHVKTKYPFLEAAKVAELRLADTDFERDRFIEARDRYQTFVRLHPTHPKVDYAAFRAALTHSKDVPSEFFLLPPSEEKDQSEVRSALAAMSDFVRGYPKSSFLAEGQQVVVDAKRRLAAHELYVAKFYAKRERWAAVVARLSVVAKGYSGVGYDEEVAFGLYAAHRQLKDEARAKEALRAFVAQSPTAPGAERARRLLGDAAAPGGTGGSGGTRAPAEAVPTPGADAGTVGV
jgi:outer membrane protein assembly factor BamD